MTCESCSTGANCAAAGQTIGTMQAESGYWRSTAPGASNADFLRCLAASSCVDGGCGTNRVGPLCALCRDGYTTDSDGTCKECPAENTALGASIGFTILLVAALIVIFYGAYHSGTVTTDSDGSVHVATVHITANDNSQRQRVAYQPVKYYNRSRRVPQTLASQFKIFLSYMQIGTALFSSVEVPYPSYFRTFLQYFTFLNLDFVSRRSAASASASGVGVCGLLVRISPVLSVLLYRYTLPLPT